MNRFKDNIKNLTFMVDWRGWIIFIIVAGIIYTYMLSTISPIVSNNLTNKNIIVKAGHTFKVCREVEYKIHSNVTISYSLTRTDIGKKSEETYSLYTFKLDRKKGNYIICRNILVPASIPAGKWKFRTYIETHTFPFWRRSFEASTINITVKKDIDED